MKIKIFLVATTVLICASTFVGCTDEKEAVGETVSGAITVETPEVQEVAPVEDQIIETLSDDSGSWHASSADEIPEKMTVCFYDVPDATNVRYSLNEEENMAQMEFELEGLKYTARLKQTDEFEDISGCNYAWTFEEKGQLSGFPSVTKRYVGEGETVDVILWQIKEAGYVFSLTTSAPDLDGFDISAVAKYLVWDNPEE